MKAKCITNSNGYESILTVGEYYEITDIQDSIFQGNFYLVGIGNKGKEFTCHLYRFDISKEQADAYVLKYHPGWRTANLEHWKNHG